MAYYSDNYYAPTTTTDGAGQQITTSTAAESVATTLSTLTTSAFPSTFTSTSPPPPTTPSTSTTTTNPQDPSSTSSAPSSLSLSAPERSSGLSIGVKAAIGSGIVVLLIFGLLGFFLLRQRRRAKNTGLLRGKSVALPKGVEYKNTNPEPFRVIGVRSGAEVGGRDADTEYNAGPRAPSSTISQSPNASRSASRSASPFRNQVPLSAQPTPATAYPGGGYGYEEHQAYGNLQPVGRRETPPPPFHSSWVGRR